MNRSALNKQKAWLLAVGEAIQERRLSVGISQQELADMAGVHRTYVSDVERGARNLTVSSLVKVCKALNVQPSRLFRRAEESEKVSR